MKVMVTGGHGLLGTAVSQELEKNNIEYVAVGRNNFDITDKEKVMYEIKKYNPDIIIHCAAYTKVDMAEIEREECERINVEGTNNVVQACKSIDATLIFISTDYIFSGEKEGVYEIYDEPSPVNFYGETKLKAEKIVKDSLIKFFIIRISWLFGENGINFVKTMMRLANEKTELSVVNDQVGSPTFSKDLAKLLVSMMITNKYGIYHATNEGYCNWAEYAKEIFKIISEDITVNEISSEEYNSRAKRPRNSKLSKQSLVDNGFELLPDWKNAVNRYILEIGK